MDKFTRQYLIEEMTVVGLDKDTIAEELELDLKIVMKELNEIFTSPMNVERFLLKRELLSRYCVTNPDLLCYIFASPEIKAIDPAVKELLMAVRTRDLMKVCINLIEKKENWNELDSQLWEILCRRLDMYELFLQAGNVCTN